MIDINELLKIAVRGRASDVHIKAGMPPIFRVDGALVPLKDGARITPEDTDKIAFMLMVTDEQKSHFKLNHEIDLSYGVTGVGRFRVSVFQQRGSVGIVFRVVPFKVFTIKELNLPPAIEKIALENRGLILVTGTTGSGKSTTLAAMIDHINANRTSHILTIEDPIEFLIRDKRSIINQREMGVDTRSFSNALRAALRQDPDVIFVGEMRDLETIETAITAAETGHLVLSTVHTLDAKETINRIIAVFPSHQQKQIRLQLASVLKAVVSQRLVPRADKKGRVCACEVMVNNSRIKNLIMDESRTSEIFDAIAEGNVSYGMQTFDQSLLQLLNKKLITYDEALKQCTNPDDFALKVKGVSSSTDSTWEAFEKDVANDDQKTELAINLDDIKIDRF
jgi:twitching motility protein PilT